MINQKKMEKGEEKKRQRQKLTTRQSKNRNEKIDPKREYIVNERK